MEEAGTEGSAAMGAAAAAVGAAARLREGKRDGEALGRVVAAQADHVVRDRGERRRPLLLRLALLLVALLQRPEEHELAVGQLPHLAVGRDFLGARRKQVEQLRLLVTREAPEQHRTVRKDKGVAHVGRAWARGQERQKARVHDVGIGDDRDPLAEGSEALVRLHSA